MKSRILLLLLALLLSCSVSAQTYHFQYSHDTLGNRVSRVYQGAQQRSIPSVDTSRNVSTELADESSDEERLPSYKYTEKDTVKVSPFIKTQAEKDSYQDSMMAEVTKLQPLPVGRDTRDITDSVQPEEDALCGRLIDYYYIYYFASDKKIEDAKKNNIYIAYPTLIINNCVIREEQILEKVRRSFKILIDDPIYRYDWRIGNYHIKRIKFYTPEQAKRKGIENISKDGVCIIELWRNEIFDPSLLP